MITDQGLPNSPKPRPNARHATLSSGKWWFGEWSGRVRWWSQFVVHSILSSTYRITWANNSIRPSSSMLLISWQAPGARRSIDLRTGLGRESKNILIKCQQLVIHCDINWVTEKATAALSFGDSQSATRCLLLMVPTGSLWKAFTRRLENFW